MEPDQLLDLSLPEIETSHTVQQDVEGTEDGQLEETESAQIGEQGISVQTEKSLVQKIIANPQLPILGLIRIEEPPTVEKPLPTLRLVKLSTILANPRQIRSKEDDKNIMDISEEEENHDESQNPNNTTAKKTSTGSHSPQYAVQRPKKRKKKIKYTSAQVNLMLSKSNSSSNTSVEITPDTPSPSNQVQREGQKIQHTGTSNKRRNPETDIKECCQHKKHGGESTAISSHSNSNRRTNPGQWRTTT